MENEKAKMTPAQIVLVVCAAVCFFPAILLIFCMSTGIFDAENIKILQPVFWIMLMVSNLFLACANWKKQKVLSTIQIGLWSFFLGAFVFHLLSLVMN